MADSSFKLKMFYVVIVGIFLPVVIILLCFWVCLKFCRYWNQNGPKYNEAELGFNHQVSTRTPAMGLGQSERSRINPNEWMTTRQPLLGSSYSTMRQPTAFLESETSASGPGVHCYGYQRQCVQGENKRTMTNTLTTQSSHRTFSQSNIVAPMLAPPAFVPPAPKQGPAPERVLPELELFCKPIIIVPELMPALPEPELVSNPTMIVPAPKRVLPEPELLPKRIRGPEQNPALSESELSSKPTMSVEPNRALPIPMLPQQELFSKPTKTVPEPKPAIPEPERFSNQAVIAPKQALPVFYPESEFSTSEQRIPKFVYHYTNIGGYNGIMRTGKIFGSEYQRRRNGSLFGRGVYLTTMKPSSKTKDLIQKNYGNPSLKKSMLDKTEYVFKLWSEDLPGLLRICQNGHQVILRYPWSFIDLSTVSFQVNKRTVEDFDDSRVQKIVELVKAMGYFDSTPTLPYLDFATPYQFTSSAN